MISLSILVDVRKSIWAQLKAFRSLGYLAGGTALALQIQHRKSYDFDVFCERPISEAQSRKILDFFQGKALINTSDELTFLSPSDIKITFLSYPYRHAFALVTTESLPMLSLRDIAAAKAYTMNRRGKYRDYVDIYFLLKNGHVSLPQIIQTARKVYAEAFSEKLFLSQITYLKDIESSDIKSVEYISEKPSKSQIEQFFVGLVKSHL